LYPFKDTPCAGLVCSKARENQATRSVQSHPELGMRLNGFLMVNTEKSRAESYRLFVIGKMKPEVLH